MEGDNPIIVVVYVDDLIILAKAFEIMNTVKQALAERFKMKDLGEIHYCLGITIVHDKERNSICMHQKQYVNSIVEKFGLASAKTVATPADGNVQLRKDDGVNKDVDATLYQLMVGSLLYAAIATHPDIAQAVGVVAKYCSKPNEAHMTAVKRILHYLKGTADLGLRFVKSENGGLVGYSDADWAGDVDNRHLTTGVLILMSGGPVSWLSKKQQIV